MSSLRSDIQAALDDTDRKILRGLDDFTKYREAIAHRNALVVVMEKIDERRAREVESDE